MNPIGIYKAIAQCTDTPVIALDGELVIRYINTSCEKITGFSSRQLKGRPLPDLFPESMDPGRFQEEVRNTIAGGEPLRHREDIWRFPDGITRKLNYCLYPVKGKRGAGTVLLILNMPPESERIERAAREWRITFDSITDFISIHDRNFKIIRMNRAFAKLFGQTPKQLLGKTCYELIHGSPEFKHKFCPFERVLKTGKTEREEFFEPALGMFLEITASPVFNENREILGCVHIAKDITARKKAEEALKLAQQELIQSEKLSAIGRFASGIAHEIRNPLGNIMACAQYCLGKKEILVDPVEEYLNIIVRNAVTANKTIKDLLDFARPRTTTLKPGDIAEVVKTLRDLVKPRCTKQNVKLVCRISPEIPLAQIDPDQLLAAFLNFATNSLDAMPEGGRLSIMVNPNFRKKETVIRFKDTGFGIPRENIDKIFEPFFTTKDEGVGLGMSLVHQIITSHGGKVSVKSNPGEFTEFNVHLPFA